MIFSVQYLRGFAALFVVYFHAVTAPRFAAGIENAGFEFGVFGVDIFFVISGFIMWQITATKEQTASEFLTRRLCRVVPMYWIATLCMFPMPMISKTIAGGNLMDLRQFIASLLFIPWPSPAFPEQIEPVYRPGWTLNYEMFFYLVFAIALIFRDRRQEFVLIICVFTGAVCLGLIGDNNYLVKVYAKPIILEFVLGVIIGWMFSSKRTAPIFVAIPMIVIGVIVLFYFPYDVSGFRRLFIWGLPAAIILFSAVSLECRLGTANSALLHALGDSSYSIYLTHVFSIGALLAIWKKVGLLANYK